MEGGGRGGRDRNLGRACTSVQGAAATMASPAILATWNLQLTESKESSGVRIPPSPPPKISFIFNRFQSAVISRENSPPSGRATAQVVIRSLVADPGPAFLARSARWRLDSRRTSRGSPSSVRRPRRSSVCSTPAIARSCGKSPCSSGERGERVDFVHDLVADGPAEHGWTSG
jgi:hypothetical protein